MNETIEWREIDPRRFVAEVHGAEWSIERRERSLTKWEWQCHGPNVRDEWFGEFDTPEEAKHHIESVMRQRATADESTVNGVGGSRAG